MGLGRARTLLAPSTAITALVIHSESIVGVDDATPMPQSLPTLATGEGAEGEKKWREGKAMTPHTDTSARTRLKTNSSHICLQCNALLFAPEWSEEVNESRVKHVWACETCGYKFETTLYYQSAE
jgi:hypothetical protein